jgi:SAM-dependent methyltransferase
MTETLPEHVQKNRAHWDEMASDYVASAERNWADSEPTWGIWGVPETELRLLPDDLDGKDAIELGCGTAYWSAWMARRGARVVGIDNSEAQLVTARRLAEQHGIDLTLVHGNAETVPYPDGSFDVAFSEYGASIWCDPYRWVPEAARLLRPGGRLIFLANSILSILCSPDTGRIEERLLRPYRGMHRFEWPAEDEGIDFHLGWGDMLRLLRANRFELEDYLEVYAPEGATSRYPWANDEWATKWPVEEIWKARKQA